jgi:hypothetical protein
VEVSDTRSICGKFYSNPVIFGGVRLGSSATQYQVTRRSDYGRNRESCGGNICPAYLLVITASAGHAARIREEGGSKKGK